MNDLRAARISKFRDKHERELLLIMAQAVTCSLVLSEGNGTLLRTEMDALTDRVLNLVEQERKATRKKSAPTGARNAEVVTLKAVSP